MTLLDTYKEALVKYNQMLLTNESSENIKYHAEYLKRLEEEIQEELKNFELIKKNMEGRTNTNYYRVSYVVMKNRRPNYRYQYFENKKSKALIRNTIEELEELVKSKGLPWFEVGRNEE